jgi:hypothetical protein
METLRRQSVFLVPGNGSGRDSEREEMPRSLRRLRITFMVLALTVVAIPAFAQQCLHGPDESPAEKTRRQQALGAARAVNTLQANQPGARTKTFVDQSALAELAAQNPALAQRSAAAKYDFKPDSEILPGWQLTLSRTDAGYWFMIKDTTDACGFAYVSNQAGIIYSAEPIR